jgi:glycosyltransferase involved in cell wall biosynthesis
MLTPRRPVSALHFTPWTQLSGAQRSLLALVAAQAAHQPTGVLFFKESPLADRARSLGATVVIVGRRHFRGDGSLGSPAKQRIVQDLISSVGATALHCHSAFGVRWMRHIAAGANLKLVCHQRDNYVPDDFHKDLDHAERIIAISRSVFATLPPELQQRASVVHNAVQIPEQGQRSERLRIGMAGRSIPEKGMHLFLDAVLPLMDRFDFTVAIWGLWSSGDRSVSISIIRRVIGLKKAHRLRIELHRFRDDVENFYGSTDIVVVPSLHPEPFGRMALEAMAWGCVTIVAGHGGLVEIVDDMVTGLVFQPGDAAALRFKLETVLTDAPLRANIRCNGRERARDEFSLEAHYHAVQQIYER